MRSLRLAAVHVTSMHRRLLALGGLCVVFLLAASAAAVFLKDEHGDVHIDALFLVGGYPAASALLLLGWLLGHLPLVAVLVLLAGVISDDRENGLARLIAVRPVSPIAVYATRFAVLATIAFVVCAVVMPAFDLLMLGTWAGPATLVLILAYVLVYGGLIAFLSAWTRGDAWLALLLAILAIVWAAFDRAATLPLAPGLARLVGFLLPPQPALFELENAFAELQPIPWDAFVYCIGYGGVFLMLAGLSVARREV
ncbi:MAG TPA: hypothetical protein VMN78_00720 [Longimicrobiales bacterium]|nr:hypothetical protein [Longimicrobiales bacterium]